jgi:serine/threonine-protein kinase
MGEVYKARDTKLGREVAIKVLPEAFAENKERLARFEREARVLASLNHPNIATLYGLEQSDGVPFLVMELADGETLAERLRRSPIPVDDALPIFKQIAEALEAAHEKGIIHRDLKPANIKVSSEGKVKVLDFGLAKAMSGDPVKSDVSESPTITRDATATGVILGTAAYMSPEQARGKTVDKRTDIWAFGCCLYEALTARTPFPGETVTDILAAVVKNEPNWKTLPAGTPPNVNALLRRCLRKGAARRLHDVADARVDLEDAIKDPEAAGLAATPETSTRHSYFAGVLVATLVVGVIAVLLYFLTPSKSVPALPMRFSIELSPTQRLWTQIDFRTLALSPDGEKLVFIGGRGRDHQIYVRSMSDLEVQPVPGTEGVENSSLFVSPDSRWVGYYKDEKLWKVLIEGGVPVPLLDSPAFIWQGDWSEDEWILFARGPISGLFRISAAGGGEPQAVTRLDTAKGEVFHGCPLSLPGGKGILFNVSVGNYNVSHIEVLSLETGERQVLIEDTHDVEYAPSGHLLFGRDGTLFAVPFDLDRLEVTGPEIPVVSNLQMDTSDYLASLFTLSGTGTLVYVPSDQGIGEGRLVWTSRQGKPEPLPVAAGRFRDLRLSPDGEQLAVGVWKRNEVQLLIYDLARNVPTQLTFEGTWNSYPVWRPDSRLIAYQSNVSGPWNTYLMPTDGSGKTEALIPSEHFQTPGSWSPDGRFLAYSEGGDERSDILILPMDQENSKPEPFQTTEFREHSPRFSPDGRWIAYLSGESGRPEIYIREFIRGSNGAGAKKRVSRNGGWEPVWSRDGKELFYRNIDGTKMMVVRVETGTALDVSEPEFLFEEPNTLPPDVYGTRTYDVAPDGRFLMISESESLEAPMKLNVILNWFEELKRLVPTEN